MTDYKEMPYELLVLEFIVTEQTLLGYVNHKLETNRLSFTVDEMTVLVRYIKMANVIVQRFNTASDKALMFDMATANGVITGSDDES